MSTAWELLTENSVAPVGSTAWEHLQAQEGGTVVTGVFNLVDKYTVCLAKVDSSVTIEALQAVTTLSSVSADVQTTVIKVST